MPLNKRAKRRIIILLVLVSGVAVLGAGAWWGRQVLKDQRAAAARVRGLEALEERDWGRAMPDLSTAVVNDPLDLEAIRGLALARRRVPSANNGHLRESMNYATRAVAVARQLDVPREELVETLLEAARIEFAIGAILNLEETCSEVVEIDPTNQEAIDSLYQVKWVRGLFLPDELRLIRKSGRTDAAWLGALREAKDTSALRWALEKLNAENSLVNREAVLRVLQEGRFEDLQRIREGEISETVSQIVSKWIEESDRKDRRLYFLLAVERIRAGDFDGAREALKVTEDSEVDSAGLLIRAATLREALGEEADRRRAAELLARAEAVPSVSPEAAGIIAIRHWSAVRPDKAQQILARTVEEFPESVDLTLNGILLAALNDPSASDEWLQRSDRLLAGGTLDALEAETLELVAGIAVLSMTEDLSVEDFQNSGLSVDSLSSQDNPLLQTLLGDLQDRVGLQGHAIESWARASKSLNGRSLEVARRLIPGLIRNQELYAAFTNALTLASNLRSAASIQMLCRAWLALEAAGIDVEQVQPGFSMWESPRELATAIYEERRERGDIAADALLLLADTIVLENDGEALVEVTRRGMESGVDVGTLIALARRNLGLDTNVVQELVEMVGELDLDEADARQRLLFELDFLRSLGRYAEVESKVSRDAPILWSSDEGDVDRIICNELIANLLDEGRTDEAVIRRCLASIEARSTLIGLFRYLVDQREEQLVNEVYEVLARRSGPRTPTAALAKAELVLAFDADDVEKINEAILLADEALAAGSSDVDLQIALARLLRLGPRPAFDRTIEVLRQGVRARPGRFDIALMLVDALQETGRYEEAGEYLQQVLRRRDQASPQARRLMSALLAGQGDVGGTAEVSCAIAEETNDVFDALQCIRALRMNGEEEAADAMLFALYENPERPIEVDLAYAQRLASLGRSDEMLDVLRFAPGYASRRELCFEVAQAAVDAGVWSVAEENLAEAESLDPDGRELKYLRARYELARPEGDWQVAEARLTELQRDPEVTPGELRAMAILRMPHPNLREGVPSLVADLRSDRPLEASFIEITFDASGPDGRFLASESVRERAKQLVRDSLATSSMWLLAIELERQAYADALARGDVFESAAIADQVISLLEQASSRYATNNTFPRQLSEMLFVLGDYTGAQLNAQEAIRRSPRSSVATADHMALARILANQQAYDEIVEILAPFSRDMVEAPLDYQRSVTLLILGHIGAGDVEEAWRILKDIQDEVGPDNAAYLWITSLPKADSDQLLRGFDLLRSDATMGRWSLLDSPELIRRLVGSDDAASRAGYQDWKNEFESGDLSLAQRLHLAVIADCIEFDDDEAEALARLRTAIELVPPSLLDRIEKFPNLSEDDQRSLATLRFLVALAMNNFLAIRAESMLAPSAGVDVADPHRDVSRIYADVLTRVGAGEPQMIDSIALHLFAEGDLPGALELARSAVELDPTMPALRLTLARILKATGDTGSAREEARKALMLARRYPNENASLIERVEAFNSTI